MVTSEGGALAKLRRRASNAFSSEIEVDKSIFQVISEICWMLGGREDMRTESEEEIRMYASSLVRDDGRAGKQLDGREGRSVHWAVRRAHSPSLRVCRRGKRVSKSIVSEDPRGYCVTTPWFQMSFGQLSVRISLNSRVGGRDLTTSVQFSPVRVTILLAIEKLRINRRLLMSLGKDMPQYWQGLRQGDHAARGM